MKISDLSKVVEELKSGLVIRPDTELSGVLALRLAEDTGNDIVLSVVAKILTTCQEALKDGISTLESALDQMEPELEMENLERVATLATELDASEEPELRAYASALDQLLMTISAPKGAALAYKQAEDAEIEKLREKYRLQALEDKYQGPRKVLDEKIKAGETAKMIAEKVRPYRPMEAPLSTRSCPEHPGAPLQRVGDSVYQCTMDKKVYDFQAGYTSLKGNKIPGGDVSLQSQMMNDRAPDHMSFDTREGRLGKDY